MMILAIGIELADDVPVQSLHGAYLGVVGE
jgi:hypothetical protein